jgi:outer membrane receptor protein involved in Fe transport
MEQVSGFSRYTVIAVMLIIPTLIAVPNPASAQVEEIVVTARKRTENIMDVPIAIQAINAQQIERQGINKLEDLQKIFTSLTLDEGFGKADVRVNIRGLTNTRGRSNVAYILDGIDTTSVAITTSGSGLLANSRLMDLERIEFIKGPQAALYGRSAFAGAISYVTKNPGEQFESEIWAQAAEYDQYELRAAIGGPVSNTFGLRLNGVTWHDGGAFKNSASGAGIDGGEGWGLALTGLWKPSDTFSLRARVEYSDDEYEAPARLNYAQGLTPLPVPVSALRVPYFSDGAGVSLPGGGVSTGPGEFCGFDSPAGCTAADPIIGDQALNPDPGYDSSPFVVIDDTCGSDPNVDDCIVGIYSTTEEPVNLSYFDKNFNPCLDTSVAGCNDASGQLFVDNNGTPGCDPNDIGCTDLSGARFPRFDVDPLTGKDFLATDHEALQASLALVWDIAGGRTFNSWTGYVHSSDLQSFDQDLTTNRQVEFLINLDGDTEIFSQELRFSTPIGKGAEFSFGGLYWYQKIDQDSTSMIVLCSPNVVPSRPDDPAGGGPFVDSNLSGTNQDAFDACEPSLTENNWQNYYLWNVLTPPDSVGPNPPLGTAVGPQPVRPESDKTNHWSLYGLLEIPLLDDDKFNLILEGRWVNEKEETVLNFAGCTLFAGGFPFFGTPGNTRFFAECPDPNVLLPGSPFEEDPVYVGSTRTEYFAPKATLEFHPTDDSLVYGYWARSQKPGGINLSPGGGASVPDLDSLIFEPEKMTVWEAGGKFTWLENRLQTNFAVFFQDFTDKQVNTQQFEPGVGLRSVSVNAGAAEILGLELDGQWFATDKLSFFYSYTYLDTEYTEYLRKGGGPDQIAQIGQCIPTKSNPDNPNNSATVCSLDLSGNELERAPKHAASLTGEWRSQLTSELDWYLEVRGNYQSERWWDDINFVELDAYTLFDAQIGLIGGKWDVLLFVENFTDDDTIKSVGNTPDFINLGSPFIPGDGKTFTLPQPRTVGLRASIRFGG